MFMHLEKIGGLSTDRYGLEYLAKSIRPSGVISTKTNIVKNAKKMGLITIQRFFSRRQRRVGQHRQKPLANRTGYHRTDACPDSGHYLQGEVFYVAPHHYGRLIVRRSARGSLPEPWRNRHFFFPAGAVGHAGTKIDRKLMHRGNRFNSCPLIWYRQVNKPRLESWRNLICCG